MSDRTDYRTDYKETLLKEIMSGRKLKMKGSHKSIYPLVFICGNMVESSAIYKRY